MSKLICLLLLTVVSVTFADQELEDLVQKVVEMLNPNANGNQNSLLLSLTNGDHFTHSLLLVNTTNNVRVNVSFSGSVTVSAERDAKKVQVSTQYKGGAALAERDRETKRDDQADVPEPFVDSMNRFLNDIYDEQEKEQQLLADDETAVLLAHGADTKKGFKDDFRKAEAKLKGGFVVGSRTKVTKNY